MGKLKLGVKLIIYISMLLALSMVFIGVLTFYRSKSELLNKVREKLQVVNNQKEKRIESHFENLNSCFDIIEKDKELLTSVADFLNTVNVSNDTSITKNKIAEKLLRKRLTSLREAFSLTRISIVTPKGRKIFETNNIHYLEEYDSENFNPGSKLFINSKHQLSYSEIYRPRFHENEYYISALYPLKYQNNITMCVIVCEMNLKELFEEISDTTGLGETGESFITKRMSGSGKIAILSPLRNQYGHTILQTFDIGDALGHEVQASMSPSKGTFKSEIIDHNGNSVDVVHSYLNNLDWGIVTKINHDESFKAIDDLRNWTIFLCSLIIFFSIIIIAIFVKRFLKPIIDLRDNMVSLAQGEFPAEIEYDNYDEIYDTIEAMNEFIYRLRISTDFAQRIGRGEITDTKAESKLGSDVLSKSLISMRQNLSKVEEDNQKRKWATEGIAIHGEVLRNNSTDIHQLSKSFISSIVTYLGAHHGGFFAINDLSDHQNPIYELVSTYAYEIDEKKNVQLKLGQGLIGQCAVEKETIYIEHSPTEFSKISSGLGGAFAAYVLIVPLKLQDQVLGVLEIASFSKILPYQVDFLEKLGESVASSILSVKTNEQTQKLLRESQSITDNLKKKEEELKDRQLKVEEEQELLREEFKRAQNTILKLKKEKKEMEQKLKNGLN